MKEIINRLIEHQSLSRAEAADVLTRISAEAFPDAQVAAFITVYLMRRVTVDELAGFRDALLDLCTSVDLNGLDSVDLCGTGGDGKNTFNISTTASLVVAAAGYPVVKHGNYGVSSLCGSSNIMSELGYRFPTTADEVVRQLEKTNYCFLHAPLFHPALKAVANIRKTLGVKTFFNMLGPLVNPCRPTRQLVGVFNLSLARLYQHLYETSDVSYCIVHNTDGYDEVSLTAPAKVIRPGGQMILEPRDLGMQEVQTADLEGGQSIREGADIVLNILSNQSTKARENVVLTNAALAIQCFEPDSEFQECHARASEALDSGKALSLLKNIISTSQN